ncbi:MAG TPA: hypothetical protein VF426_13050 [Marmoricola sp.]
MTIIYLMGAWLVASFPLAILIGRSFDRAGVSVDAHALDDPQSTSPRRYSP